MLLDHIIYIKALCAIPKYRIQKNQNPKNNNKIGKISCKLGTISTVDLFN